MRIIISKLKPAYKIVETAYHMGPINIKKDQPVRDEFIKIETREVGEQAEVFYNSFKNIIKIKRYFFSSL